ncbi:energy-coupling factor transport system permease protein [Sporobacter termitidis DSM 10068]|uniref:Energy-coupling factor transport system permease protein n=1 Tax=Sporobacter termitidis DSM 10068 TaxID=1123282 RepID=A0A1M5YT29_9FIRM|nr:energy-coupling factor transporter transmembrane component T [Sporobacter termitidis]SHI14980.1 energy-coupling factor transport system permease protein [Sporobacter termitidis DSM 10068]
MANKDAFSSYHPLINFLYFGFVLVFSMVFTHPVCLGISLSCAIAYSVYLNGRKAVRFNLLVMLPMFVLAALVNPAFSHEGGTILAYLPGGNPLTLESITYGIAMAAMLVAVIVWFSCYNAVMTSDKFVYLFGRVIPAMSLLLSMTLRFVPKFKAQIKVVSNAQKCVGRDASNGGILRRAKNGLTILSIMITWVLENAIETADSMKSRGYGLPGRTAFSIYRFDKRDRAALLFLLLCGACVVAGALAGGLKWRYYPTMKGVGPGAFPLSVFLAYLALCITPVVINITEDKKWTAIQSAA